MSIAKSAAVAGCVQDAARFEVDTPRAPRHSEPTEGDAKRLR